jgi:hypothetical protein
MRDWRYLGFNGTGCGADDGRLGIYLVPDRKRMTMGVPGIGFHGGDVAWRALQLKRAN